MIGREVLRQQDFPEQWTFSIAGPTDTVVGWFEDNLRFLTEPISNASGCGLEPLKDLLQGLPWWMVAGGAALIGWAASRVSGWR